MTPYTQDEIVAALELRAISIFSVPLLELLCKIYGDEDAVRWLQSPQPLLGGAIPDELVETAEGRARVLMVLRAILDGVYL